MAAGPITITGAWEDAEGEPASGTVSFQRHDTIQDVDVVIVANQVEVVQLEDDGTIDTEVIAADPDDPNPLARFFRVTERIRHTARAVVYDIEVDSDSDPVDLTTVARVTALPAAVYQYEVAGTTAIERERAMAAEEQLASDLAAEIARATAAEDALGALIEALSPDGAPVWPSVTAMLDPATDVTGGAFTTVDIWDTSGAVFVAGIPRSAIAAGTRVLLPSGPNVGIWVATASGPFTLADPQPAYGAIGGVNFGPDGPFLVVAGSVSGVAPVDIYVEVSGIPATVARTATVDDLAADVADAQADIALLDSDAAALAGRTTDLEDAVAALPDPLWQPVVPTGSFGNTIQMADLLAGDMIWEVDPSISLHNLYVDAADDLTPLGGMLPLIVPNPGPGKWSRFSLNIVNASAYGFSLTVPGATTGAPPGGCSAGFIAAIAVEVWGGDPNPVVLQSYRLAMRPI